MMDKATDAVKWWKTKVNTSVEISDRVSLDKISAETENARQKFSSKLQSLSQADIKRRQKSEKEENEQNKKLSYCWETVRRESMPRIAEMDVEMTT